MRYAATWACCLLWLAPAVAATPAETWQVITLDKTRIGFVRTTPRTIRSSRGEPLLRTDSDMRMTLKRFGEPLKIETHQETLETPEGDLVSFHFEMRNPPALPTKITGRVVDGVIVGHTDLAGTVRDFSLPREHEIKSPCYLDRRLRESPPKPGETLSMNVFAIEQLRMSSLRAETGKPELIALLDGRRRNLVRLTISQSLLPQAPTLAHLDERGEMLVSSVSLLGQPLTMYIVPAAEALREVGGEQLDLSFSTLARCQEIVDPHRTTKVVYRARMKGDNPTPHFSEYAIQQVAAEGPDRCLITVTAARPARSNRSIRVDRKYLNSSRLLQTTDPAVMTHVAMISQTLVDPADIAVAMEKYVQQKMRRKDLSVALASAAEVAKSLDGDCTEHAVLLAAMLRARKIPSKVVVGLVYLPALESMTAHMWTEALLGDRWTPLDATLGLGGIGAAHIKLGESALSDDEPSPLGLFLPLLQVLGRVEFDVVATEGNSRSVPRLPIGARPATIAR